MASLQTLHELGQSTWLNYLRNSFIRSGELARQVDMGIQGVTANAVAYERAIVASKDYDEAIRRAVGAGTPVKVIHEALMVDDIQRAADVLHPVWEASDHLDGFVSFEIDPALLHDVTALVAAVRHLEHKIDRPNTMVEIPATEVGIEAIEALIADGVCVNATHIFSVETYERVARAYIDGLEAYIRSHSVWRVTPSAVASFSLSAVDSEVDQLLAGANRPDLAGKTAVALAQILYARFEALFSEPRWQELEGKGGRVLRPKWTRTTPRDFHLPPTYYLYPLVGAGTIFTFSIPNLNAYDAGPATQSALPVDLTSAKAHLTEVANAGVDLAAVSDALLGRYLAQSDRRFQSLMQAVMTKRDALDRDWALLSVELGALQTAVDERSRQLCRDLVISRIWAHDHTVWAESPDEITNRLDWLHIAEAMLEQEAPMLAGFSQSLVDEGFTTVVLLGMGGSSLAPELFHNSFGRPARPPNQPFPYLDLVVVDTTDARAIATVAGELDLAHTLFIVATKSGGTVETLSAFKYFYNLVAAEVGSKAAGAHFAAITDPGSRVVALADRYRFRHVFLNDPNIGGRYSALSYFGLVAAALVGVQLDALLERGAAAAAGAMVCDPDHPRDNAAAYLGAIMGTGALAGRDKLTFITSPALASFGDWVEQLIAESTGKQGKGILPVVGEPPRSPDAYGHDRLFVHLRLDGDAGQDAAVQALREAGQPVVTVRLRDLYDLGSQFVLWEMATAVAGHILGINPFDQPNVESAKQSARQVIVDYGETGALPAGDSAAPDAASVRAFLGRGGPGDYVALQAFVTPTPENAAALQRLREVIGERTGLATTTGFGPRFLHSTGQLHKGDGGNGLFIQFVSVAENDIPIPDEAGSSDSSIGFDVLKQAQALGDAQALKDARRRVQTYRLGDDTSGELAALAESI